MEKEDKFYLSKIRFEHAKEDFSAAKDLLKTNKYKPCANRSYYAIFHAMRAVLVF